VLTSDGGGRTKAALRPIIGADKVARFLAAITAQGLALPDLEVAVTDVNGIPGVVAWVGGVPYMALVLLVADELVEQVLIMVNPDKLAGLVVPT
jgi:RNA polymerase sigma-70 factor (ECF subfamily)